MKAIRRFLIEIFTLLAFVFNTLAAGMLRIGVWLMTEDQREIYLLLKKERAVK